LFISIVAGLGSSIVVTALIGAMRTRTAVERAIDATGPPTAQVEAGSNAAVQALARLPGVRAVESLELYPGRVEGSSADVTLTATPDSVGRTTDLINVDQGRLPDPAAATEVLLTSVLADTLGLGIGDELEFAALSPEQLEAIFSEEGPGDQQLAPGPRLALTIVGIGDYFVDRVQISGTNATAYVSMAFSRRHASDAGHLGGTTGIRGLGYLWVSDKTELAAVTALAQTALPDVNFEGFGHLARPSGRRSADRRDAADRVGGPQRRRTGPPNQARHHRPASPLVKECQLCRTVTGM
jgi:hypothetical protein